jgi:hypothetical protein
MTKFKELHQVPISAPTGKTSTPINFLAIDADGELVLLRGVDGDCLKFSAFAVTVDDNRPPKPNPKTVYDSP